MTQFAYMLNCFASINIYKYITKTICLSHHVKHIADKVSNLAFADLFKNIQNPTLSFNIVRKNSV